MVVCVRTCWFEDEPPNYWEGLNELPEEEWAEEAWGDGHHDWVEEDGHSGVPVPTSSPTSGIPTPTSSAGQPCLSGQSGVPTPTSSPSPPVLENHGEECHDEEWNDEWQQECHDEEWNDEWQQECRDEEWNDEWQQGHDEEWNNDGQQEWPDEEWKDDGQEARMSVVSTSVW